LRRGTSSCSPRQGAAEEEAGREAGREVVREGVERGVEVMAVEAMEAATAVATAE
jgi:hypothetical protein